LIYKLTVALLLVLVGALCHAAETNTIPLELTDGLSGKPVVDAVVIVEDGPSAPPCRG
jgi:hypothetical protein